jgi:MIP family channel proteins
MEKLKTPFTKQLFAEFFGTFALVFVGCGAIIVHTLTNAISHFGIALAFGLVVMTMISVTGHVSMAHFNPAVTFAFALTNYFPWKKVLPYWISQLLGASLAAALLKSFFGSIANLGATTPANTTSQSFWLELLLTAILMFVILAVATDAKADGHLAAIMIGATVAMNALWAGPISGASMNPARSFGPALLSGTWHAHWIYWLAPLIGASLGALAYTLIRSEK